MYVDCHTHISDNAADLASELETIRRLNILTLAVSTDIPGFRLAQTAAQKEGLITAAFGVHPSRAADYENRLEELDIFLDAADVIGEIGLCSVWAGNLPAQMKVFAYQLRYAAQHNKPVNLHTSGQEREILTLLRQYLPPAVLIHWYDGPPDVLDELVRLGCYFSVSADIETASAAKRILERVSIHRLLTETDGKAAIHWAAGETAGPEFIRRVSRAAAKQLGLPLEIFCGRMRENYLRYLRGV